MLDSRAGAVPIGFVFLQESGRLRILVVSLAGVPVLQGVDAARMSSAPRIRRTRERFLVQQSAPHASPPAVRFVRSPCRLAFPVLRGRAFNLTCAHPAGSGAAAAGRARRRGARCRQRRRRRWRRCRRRPKPTTDDGAHRAARAGQADRAPRRPRLRDAGRVDGRGRALRGRAARVGRRGAHPGRRRIRAGPGRRWFSSLPVGGADNNGGARERRCSSSSAGRCPRAANTRIAHVYLPAACNGAPEHFRFALPDAEPHAADRARAAYWANGFAHHVTRQRLGRVRGGARPRAVSRPHGEGGRRPTRCRATRATERKPSGARHEGEGQAEGEAASTKASRAQPPRGGARG